MMRNPNISGAETSINGGVLPERASMQVRHRLFVEI